MNIRALTIKDSTQIQNLLRLDPDGEQQIIRWIGFSWTNPRFDWHIWHDPDIEPNSIWGGFDQNKLVGFCVGVRRPWKKDREHTGFIKCIYVAPSHRRKGVATQLWKHLYAAFETKGILNWEYGSAAPWYFFTGVPKEDIETRSFLKNLGWNELRERINLTISLPALKKLTKDFEPVPMCTVDRKEIEAFVSTTFSPSWANELKPVFEEGPAFGHIIRQAGKIVGFVAVHATNPQWLGPMGIDPALRGTGLGRTLLLSALQEAHQRGSTALLIPWVNEGFYQHCLGDLNRQIFFKYTFSK